METAMNQFEKTVQNTLDCAIVKLSDKYGFNYQEAVKFINSSDKAIPSEHVVSDVDSETDKPCTDTTAKYEYKKYITTTENLRKTINTYGVAIIPNVLNEEECNAIVNGIWDFFEHITQDWTTPIKRDNQRSWNEFYKLFPSHSMLVQHWGIGHSQISWDLRQNEKIVEIFSQFWKCKPSDLLVSFDGLSFNLPPEITKRGWNKNNTWYHSDQTYTDNDFKCIQSWVTGLDVNDGDATLSIMEGSNKYHKEFAEKFQVTDKKNWYKLSREQEEFYFEKGCHYKNIMCPKGSLVFWDSRTIHCGIEAVKTRAQPNFRAIVYLCYMPRSIATSADLKKKQKAFEELRSTSHWPSKPTLFGKIPNTYGNEVPITTPVKRPILTKLGKHLAGF
jgi:ectoine hydroxylase-related dioxygenase (phytanoyl-CoA dioxygenase family)